MTDNVYVISAQPPLLYIIKKKRTMGWIVLSVVSALSYNVVQHNV